MAGTGWRPLACGQWMSFVHLAAGHLVAAGAPPIGVHLEFDGFDVESTVAGVRWAGNPLLFGLGRSNLDPPVTARE